MTDEQIRIAVGAMQALREGHDNFIAAITAAKGCLAPAGVLLINEGVLTGHVFGITYRVEHRLVARDGAPFAMEYSFLAKQGDEDHCLLCVYLDLGEALYLDPEVSTRRLADAVNPRASRLIFDKLAAATLESTLLLPRAAARQPGAGFLSV